jgi:prepilin-type N-terminal cleavage/methylation domain-containing protein
MQNLTIPAKAIVRARRDEVAKNDDGFTLIELLVVIAVIGILAAIVVFGVANFRAQATDKACTAAQTTVTTATEAYFANTGAVAAVFDSLTTAGHPSAGSLQAGDYLKPGFAMPVGPPACALPTNVVVTGS